MPSPVNFILSRRRLDLQTVAAATAALAGFGRCLPPLWPVHCLVCREPCEAAAAGSATGLCLACRAALPWNRRACARCALPMPTPTAACGRCLRRPPPLTETRAVFVYGPPLDRLLPRLKFHDDLATGRLLAGLMGDAFARVRERSTDSVAACEYDDAAADAWPDALIPLPLHRRRLRTRGYDQALELARPLSQRLDIPLRTDLLLRRRDTSPQSRLDAAARRKNVRDAFTANVDAIARATRSRPAPTHVVLIDDVMTTGATLHAAAETLLRAGVARVDAWVCARVA